MGNPNLKNNLKVFRARNDLTQADLAIGRGTVRAGVSPERPQAITGK